ncbi:DUF1592 domain-containing protein [Bremerella sp. P1]|uniref:DUF1592 domain-containing protein n=1 Tax=Bremerella sp. P1 TaxID=3026424 RepID=UPI0023674468|nr:DUF1592 domain-containing protein [Bremerella sp. P1]WDI43760.1 DUF1592 domain-containing protein [Bremerella sp. P1]
MAISENTIDRHQYHAIPYGASLAICVALLLTYGQTPAFGQNSETSPIKRFFEANCFDCHSGSSTEGGLDLEVLSLDLGRPEVFELWTKIHDRVESGDMPPRDFDQPNAAARESFLEMVNSGISSFQANIYYKYGRVRGRRLNRKQVESSLHDLLGIDIPLVPYLLVDGESKGFSTVVDGQEMSDFHLSAHLKTLNIALDEAFRRALTSEEKIGILLGPEEIGARGGTFNEPTMWEGKAVAWSAPLNMRLYGVIPATRVSSAGWYECTVRVSTINPPESGGVWTAIRSSAGGIDQTYRNYALVEAEPKSKTVRFTAWIPEGHKLVIRPCDRSIRQERITGAKKLIYPDQVGKLGLAGVSIESITMRKVYIRDDKQVRKNLFGDLPIRITRGSDRPFRVISTSPERDAHRLISEFARHAHRRPLTDEEIAPFVAEVDASFEKGEDLVTALRRGYLAILSSPRFLYFVETPGQLDDYELATRLSYFLTNSTPDETLLRLAESGQLRDINVLRMQIQRLLEEDGLNGFVNNFAAEWLDLDQFNFTTPDLADFPTYDPIVEQSLLSETESFLVKLFRDNLSVTNLVDSEFAMVNSRLAKYYNIENVSGDEIRPVELPPNSPRGGLLTQGAILKVTSDGKTTSPVIRGVWISERLMGVHIPPPSAAVPAIEPDTRGATTIREQLIKHRSDSACAACHSKIDPPGFVLESFDAAGGFRTHYKIGRGSRKKQGQLVQTAYYLPGGKRFKDINDFKRILAEEPEMLARNLIEKLLVYGTGNPIEFADRPVIDDLVERSKSVDYGIYSILELVIASPLFLHK